MRTLPHPRAITAGLFAGLFAGQFGSASLASAQLITIDLPAPTLDRWMYPFASTPGAEQTAATFGAILQPGFDDRDAQVLLGFDTASLIPAGQAARRYQIRRLHVTATVSSNNVAIYDDSPDSVTTLYAEGDPARTTDADAGKPIELFGVGYRNGFTSATFLESTPFSTTPSFPPQEQIRSAFAAGFDSAGQLTDLSLQVRQRREALPWAVGITHSLEPGAPIPAGTELSFDIDLCSPGVRAYFQAALAQGRVRVMITSLAPATGGPGGGTGDPTYPTFYTKENPVATAQGWTARLEGEVKLGSLADMNADEGVTVDDLLLFLAAFEEGGTTADLDGDCGVTVDDLLLFLVAFEEG